MVYMDLTSEFACLVKSRVPWYPKEGICLVHSLLRGLENSPCMTFAIKESSVYFDIGGSWVERRGTQPGLRKIGCFQLAGIVFSGPKTKIYAVLWKYIGHLQATGGPKTLGKILIRWYPWGTWWPVNRVILAAMWRFTGEPLHPANVVEVLWPTWLYRLSNRSGFYFCCFFLFSTRYGTQGPLITRYSITTLYPQPACFFLWRQFLNNWPKLAMKSLCVLGSPWTYNSPTPTSRVIWLNSKNTFSFAFLFLNQGFTMLP